MTGTETVDGGAANGCDSIITVNLTLLEVATSIVAENICSDESVVVNGVTYDKDKLTGTETVNGGAANGCDSIITVNLTLLELATSTVAENICPDESVVVNGVTYDKDKLTGTETVIGGAANGCDSVITVNLTLLEVATSTVAQSICPDESVTVNGVTYDKDKLTGTETVTGGAANGCDSIITVNLTLLEVATSTVAENICPDGSVVVNGVTYDKDKLTGTETVTGGAANGCDSVITVNLTLLEVATSTIAQSICPDESVTVNGVTYDKDKLTGTETVTGGAANGCDSVITINLTLLEVATSTVEESICPDESVVVNGVTYDKDKLTGTETVTGGAANGCDSVITVNLTLLEVATSTIAQSICSDESVTVNGVTYDKDKLTGTETVTGGAANGCDSVITINLTLLEVATSTVEESICPDESVVVNGVTYDKDKLTGTETVTGGAANGCDSIITVNLTLLEVATSTVTENICPDESVVVNGVTYDKDKLTGTETVTGGAANGCDSIITVNLTLLTSVSSNETYTGCKGDGYEVIVGSTTFNESNATGSITLTSANGCDSVVTVNLVFNDLPNMPAVSDASYCVGQNTPLSATGTNLLWYTEELGGTGNATAPIPNTTDEGIEMYWVSQTVNGCESPRAKITVTTTSCDCNGGVNELEVTGILGQIVAGEYLANVRVYSSGKIVENANVVFKGGSTINLYPGFEVPKNSTFHAYIEACETSSGVVENSASSRDSNPLNSKLENHVAPIQLKVSPNPFRDMATIEFTLPQEETVSVGLFDQTGRRLDQVISGEKLSKGNYQIPLNSYQLRGGFFYVILQTPTERQVQKVIIIKN